MALYIQLNYTETKWFPILFTYLRTKTYPKYDKIISFKRKEQGLRRTLDRGDVPLFPCPNIFRTIRTSKKMCLVPPNTKSLTVSTPPPPLPSPISKPLLRGVWRNNLQQKVVLAIVLIAALEQYHSCHLLPLRSRWGYLGNQTVFERKTLRLNAKVVSSLWYTKNGGLI